MGGAWRRGRPRSDQRLVSISTLGIRDSISEAEVSGSYGSYGCYGGSGHRANDRWTDGRIDGWTYVIYLDGGWWMVDGRMYR